MGMMAGLKDLGLWFFIVLTGVCYSYPVKKGSHDASAASSQAFQNPPLKRAQSMQQYAQMRPTPALYNANAFAAPVYLAYDVTPDSSSQVYPSEGEWAVQPPGPFSDGTSPQNQKFVSKPEPLGLSKKPTVPVQSPFRSGESSFVEKVYDRGNYDSQMEEQGLPFPYGPIRIPTRYPVSSFLKSGPPVGGMWFGYPNDYMVLQAPVPSDWHPPMIMKM